EVGGDDGGGVVAPESRSGREAEAHDLGGEHAQRGDALLVLEDESVPLAGGGGEGAERAPACRGRGADEQRPERRSHEHDTRESLRHGEPPPGFYADGKQPLRRPAVVI